MATSNPCQPTIDISSPRARPSVENLVGLARIGWRASHTGQPVGRCARSNLPNQRSHRDRWVWLVARPRTPEEKFAATRRSAEPQSVQASIRCPGAVRWAGRVLPQFVRRYASAASSETGRSQDRRDLLSSRDCSASREQAPAPLFCAGDNLRNLSFRGPGHGLSIVPGSSRLPARASVRLPSSQDPAAMPGLRGVVHGYGPSHRPHDAKDVGPGNAL